MLEEREPSTSRLEGRGPFVHLTIEQVHRSSQLALREPVTSQTTSGTEPGAVLEWGAHVTFSGVPVAQLTAWFVHAVQPST